MSEIVVGLLAMAGSMVFGWTLLRARYADAAKAMIPVRIEDDPRPRRRR